MVALRTQHLTSALIALLLLCAGVLGGNAYAESVENRYVHALAPAWFPQKSLGSALQKAAFHQPDLLPVYGASELGYPDPYDAKVIFQKYPTGFTIFTVGRAIAEPLTILERLAAIGVDLRGKKVVITLSPDFATVGMTSTGGYAFNFSPLHAYEVAFSADLSLELKREVAVRMLDYPETLRKYPLLNFALERLGEGSPASLALYYAILPLGKIQTLVLRLQDHWETIDYIQSQSDLKPNVPRRKKTLDWDALLEQAGQNYQRRSDSNPFGIENEEWVQQYSGDILQQKNILSDKWFLDFIATSKGWEDLDMLLRELKELGAQPLILSAPLHGPFYDYLGISAAARQSYYDKLPRVVSPYGVPLLEFADHDQDTQFLIDPLFHLSSVGWVYYAQALDAFYHGTLQEDK
jgi:D-alanine transfer protein